MALDLEETLRLCKVWGVARFTSKDFCFEFAPERRAAPAAEENLRATKSLQVGEEVDPLFWSTPMDPALTDVPEES